ncbi:DUF4168 domain-containing protein [Acidocella aminolytica]|uniref:DUF4168 domain-containing protein n=1 Tax=Acidocella aminolytica 101 = DSM 11237 TaxID=1120923 RepID=A0A0D6PF88_9PROT|nr:DUF4168 domain-containing protein [Acidocella aminolytica]GAN79524.1 hypothetical protein Aam_022_011 [Acidocella aminolytica 101 = DSM 11237]GBQ32645.1 hypothetical protein AA11237_0206 [Acidocella aminolytica 101 = DSM 11237]SHF34542.1 protein of unknown function [Acidocella aminolytica 101 = DSM 11237]
MPSIDANSFSVTNTFSRKILATFGLIGAFSFTVPALAQTPQGQMPMQGATGQAEKYSNNTINSVAHAMHDVEKVRKQYLPEMQAAQQHKDQQKIQQLNNAALKAEKQKIISNGISIQKYQEVVTSAEKNPKLRKKILTAYNSNSTK